MKSDFLQFPLVLPSQCLFAGMSSAFESRYGLSFSSTTIVASRFNSSTESIELTAIPASSDYRNLYTQAVCRYQTSDDVIDEVNVESIFQSTVAPIIDILTKQTGQAPEIATLFLPSVIDWKTRSVAAKAVFANAQYATRAAPSHHVACYGYGFLEGKNLGRTMHEYNDNAPNNLVLLFEYESEYLHAWLVEFEFELGVYYPQQEKICKACGEGRREGNDRKSYQERVNTFVQDFVELNVFPQNNREDIRAIVIMGEASAKDVQELGKIALDAVGTETVKLMTDFEPSEVVAHGAAIFSRLTQDHPEYFISRSTNKVPDESYWADVVARQARQSAEHDEL